MSVNPCGKRPRYRDLHQEQSDRTRSVRQRTSSTPKVTKLDAIDLPGMRSVPPCIALQIFCNIKEMNAADANIQGSEGSLETRTTIAGVGAGIRAGFAARAGTGVGAGSGSGSDVGVRVLNTAETSAFTSCKNIHLVNRNLATLENTHIERILRDAQECEGLGSFIEKLESHIQENSSIPSNIKKSKRYLLHRLMKELTPTEELRKKHYKNGISSINYASQVEKAYVDYKKLDNESFLICASKLQETYEAFAPDLTSLGAIKEWMMDPANQGVLETTVVIRIKDSELKSIPHEFLNFFPNLAHLHLYKSKIREIPFGVFDGLVGLKGLCLDNNQIREIPLEAFKSQINLEYLNLFNNEIRKIPLGIFKTLSSLATLYLHGNEIQEIPLEAFKGLTSLNILELSSNEIQEIPLGAFKRLKSLKCLNVSFNTMKPRSLEGCNKLLNQRKEIAKESIFQIFGISYKNIVSEIKEQYKQLSDTAKVGGANIILLFRDCYQKVKSDLEMVLARSLFGDLEYSKFETVMRKVYTKAEASLGYESPAAFIEEIKHKYWEACGSLPSDSGDWARENIAYNLPKLHEIIVDVITQES